MIEQLGLFETSEVVPVNDIEQPEIPKTVTTNLNIAVKSKLGLRFRVFGAVARLSFPDRRLTFYPNDQEKPHVSCPGLEGNVIIGACSQSKSIWVISFSNYSRKTELELLNLNSGLRLYSGESLITKIESTEDTFFINSRLFNPAIFTGFAVKPNTPLVVKKANCNGLCIFRISENN
jgi:hypothetical protein